MTTHAQTNDQQPPTNDRRDDLLWRHLKTVPAFRALLRAVEARFYRHIDIPRPGLDLGCGDGHFAQMTFDEPLAAGADPWWGPLQKARRAGIYRLPVQALGDALPFPDDHFASVISNSVLEHIPAVQPVLNEANRVLRPGGQLVVTMPSHLFTEYLGGVALLRPLGLDDQYRAFFNAISRHAHTDRPERWAERLAQAGFRVTRWQYYFSKGALRALEWGHVQGLPSAVLHALTGHWILAPWQENLRRTEQWVRPFYEEEFPPAGAYLFLVAQKEARGPITAPLPPPNPFSIEELQQEEKVEIGEQRLEIGPDAPPHATEETHPVAETAIATETPTSEPISDTEISNLQSPVSNKPFGRAIITAALASLSLLLAIFGQTVLSARPEEPWAGVRLYGYALLSLGVLVAYRRSDGIRLPRPGTLPRRRWLFPAALLLALIAHRLAGTSLFDGNPIAAILLWLAAIATAYYALTSHLPQTNTSDTPPATRHLLPATHPITITLIIFLIALLLRLVDLTNHPFILNGVEASIGLDAAAVLNGQIRNPFATAWLTNPTLPLYLLAVPLEIFGRTVLGIRVVSAVAGAATVAATYLIGRRLWGKEVGLVAAILLAGSHFHLQYSRLGMTNVWDPLLVLLALGLIAVARREGTRRAWLWAGVATGLNAYFFTASHLLPLMLAGLLLYFLLFDRPGLKKQGRHALAALGLALVVALPQVLYYNANPGLYMERANSLGIFQTSWLLQEATRTGRDVLTLLGDQFWQAALAFNYSLDTSTSYKPGIPLLRFWPSVFFVLGLGLAVLRLRRLRHALLLIWWTVTIIFAGALLVSPPDSHRLVVAAPAGALLAATGLVWLAEKLADGLRQRTDNGWQRFALPVLVGLAVLITAGDVVFYFGRYRAEHRFGDRNTEIAHEIATYLDTLDGDTWTAYFYGPPTMYVGFPTIPFLAEEFEPNVNLFDVEAENVVPDVPGRDENLTFLFLPERADELNAVRQRFPGGQGQVFDGILADPLFFAYEVQR